MTSDTCPHCGAAADKVRCPGNDNWYACGTMEIDPKDRGGKCYRNEISNLRSQNRDLQQAYDHVLECEQNRCREVVELQDKLAAVTAERDMAVQNCDNVFRAIDGIRSERDELLRRIDEAPVWYMENGGFVSAYAVSFRSDKQNLTRVRVIRDDQPGETDA